MRLIFHRATGTILDADECEILTTVLPIEMWRAASGTIPKGHPVVDASTQRAIFLDAEAIKEHCEEHDKTVLTTDFTDEDYQAVGEWALDAHFLWDGVYEAIDYGIAKVLEGGES